MLTWKCDCCGTENEVDGDEEYDSPPCHNCGMEMRHSQAEQRAAALQAENKRLREACNGLMRYLSHNTKCATGYLDRDGEYMECTCGLDNEISKAGAAATPTEFRDLLIAWPEAKNHNPEGERHGPPDRRRPRRKLMDERRRHTKLVSDLTAELDAAGVPDDVDLLHRVAVPARELTELRGEHEAHVKHVNKILARDAAAMEALEQDLALARENLDQHRAGLASETQRATRWRTQAQGHAEQVRRLETDLDDARRLAEVRGAGCQCSDDEACKFVRQRDEARAEVVSTCETASKIMTDLEARIAELEGGE